MFWLDLTLVLVITIILVAVLAALGGVRHNEGLAGTLWIFALIFLVTWALGLWIQPIGPPIWGAFWLPFLLVAVFVTLILAAVGEASRRRTGAGRADRRPVRPPEGELAAAPEPETEGERVTGREASEAAAAIGCGLFFWILVVVAVTAIVARYA